MTVKVAATARKGKRLEIDTPGSNNSRRRRVTAPWAALEMWRARYTRPGSLLWTRNVNHRGGALLAILFSRTRVTPNALTVGALTMYVAGATYVATHRGSFTFAAALLVAVVWQFAFCLDCADGQLARARQLKSPFGAWLDQVCDFVAHMAVLTAVVAYLAHALNLDGVRAVLLLAAAAGANLLQLFASSQRNTIIGTAPARRHGSFVRMLTAGRHLSDWGGVTLACALLLPLPHALVAAVIAAAVLALLTVVGQVALNWSGGVASAPGGES